MIGVDVRIRRKFYQSTDTMALEGTHFSIGAGEFVAIVGPSGAGKTTLLNLASGLDRDFDGELRLVGTPSAAPDDPIRLGFVFQQPRLVPWLTVLDNVCLVLDSSEAERERARSLLCDVGLQEFEGAFPAQLSGGMQRRVALARAFVVRPDLLLMDEPFLSLDDPTAWRLRDQLMSLWDERRPTVLYVTHDLREALTLAGRILFFSARPGRVILDHAVDLPRPRGPRDPRITRAHEQLLAEHPNLLSGVSARRDRPEMDGEEIETTPRPRMAP